MTLEIITSDVLQPLRHGFFTRRGGASSGVFEGLNCGRGSSDQSDAVEINRDRAAQAMAASAADLRGLHQTHSARAVIAESRPSPITPDADGIVTREPGLVLAVLTADCAPVLFADHQAGVVGAAHAGWRGALGGILESTLARMEDLGASRANIAAVIGPTISQRAYEVSPEFMDEFLSDDPGHHRFFAGGPNGRPMFDLPSYGLMRLREAGAEAEWIGRCTYADPERFFSYRRSTHLHEADYGRLISVIRL